MRASRGRRPRQPRALEGRVRDLGARGDGVVETGAGVVFVPGVYLGEEVRIRPSGTRAGASRGVLLEVVEPSPDRVDAPCAVASRCGGCPWMTLRPDAQRAAKAERVARATGVAKVPIEGSGSGLGTRSRARLHFARGALGYHAPGSRTVVDATKCPVLEPALEEALQRLRARLLPTLRGEGTITLALGGPGADRPVASVRSAAPQPAEAYDALRSLVGDTLAGAELQAGEGTVPARFGDPLERRPSLGAQILEAPPGGFSQAQVALNLALVAHVVSEAAVDGLRVLELFAGHGNFTVPLAATAGALVAVEADAAAADACARNLAAAGLTAHTTVRQADAATRRTGARFDVVVLDPPRRGAGDAVEVVLDARARRVVYVSCEPATLSTDLAALARDGLVPVRVRAFDMFPHTPHVETVVTLAPAAC